MKKQIFSSAFCISILCVSVIISLLLAVTFQFKVEDYRDTNIRSGYLRCLPSVFFAHVGETRYITVFGRTYKAVEGGRPYYIKIPEWHTILFVTKEAYPIETLHFLNVMSGDEWRIHTVKSSFGSNINTPEESTNIINDFIENVSSNSVVLRSRIQDRKWRIVVNAESKRIETEEFNGKIVYQYNATN